ncbi:peptidase S8/S53 domain-containing protein [Sporodiniella umbellata]|nr:peptidase S8/S53 domain-containing protein [Sporodiniella umbellata]
MNNINIGKGYKAVAGSFHPQFVNYLSNLEDVEFVEQNQVYKAPFFTSNIEKTPYSHSVKKHRNTKRLQKRDSTTQWDVPSWGISRINQRDFSEPTIYTVEEDSGAGIHVYILDSGIQEDHPDFDDRAQLDANFITYEMAEDYSGHGTHVAGIIGGNIFGVAKKVDLHGIKILDRNGDGTTSALLQVFVSAGNTGDDACDYSPSANPDVFAVGASDIDDNIPSFSSSGNCVSLYAPGTNITSTWIEDSALTMDGTSMANPHVSGIAAMLMTERTFESTEELYDTLKSIATPNILTSIDDSQEALLAYNGPERD